jgi:pilus assembly protein Flp/PilA
VLDTFNAMIKDDEGATLVEYGLVVSLIAVAAITALTTLGGNVKAMFESVAGQIHSS